MKFLLVNLILISFLPLKSFAGCKSLHSSSSTLEKSCHQNHGDHGTSSRHGDQDKPVVQTVLTSSSECPVCETGLCHLLSIPKRFLLSKLDDLKPYKCQWPEDSVYPFELFLMPGHERGPPPEQPKLDRRGFLLSDVSWQAYFSIFII